MMNKENCPFCDNFDLHRQNVANLIPEWRGTSLTVAESPHLVVVAEPYPIVPNPYYLIVPREHNNSFADVSPRYDGEMSKIMYFLQNLSGTNEFVLFEHGDRQDSERKTKSISHAHAHFIPIDGNFNILSWIEDQLRNYGVKSNLVEFEDLGVIRQLQSKVGEEDYLLFSPRGKRPIDA